MENKYRVTTNYSTYTGKEVYGIEPVKSFRFKSVAYLFMMWVYIKSLGTVSGYYLFPRLYEIYDEKD